MASETRDTPPSLPEHLIFNEVFPRLPVKSIHRFRCVSTSCRRLPSDQQFLSAFRRLSGRRHYMLSLSHHSQGLVLYRLNLQSGIAGKPQYTSYHGWTHLSIINGLMFKSWPIESGYNVTVSNAAATEEEFPLPPPLPAPPSIWDFHFFYLCHNPESRDRYKVLRTEMSYENDRERKKFSIFTLGADSSWRDFDINLPKFKQSGDSKSVCINGTLYLTRFCNLDNIAVICAFIVESENFYGISYPSGLPPSRYDQCHLIELKGALAVIDKETYKSEIIKLWVKEKGQFEFSDHESWTELRIDFDPRWEVTNKILDKRFSFSTNNDGEIVMGVLAGWKVEDGCWIFIYNVDKGEWTTRVEIQGLRGDRYVHSINLCVDEENVENPSSLKQIFGPRLRPIDFHQS